MSRDVQLQFENMKQDVASTELAGATIVAQASKASANKIAVEDVAPRQSPGDHLDRHGGDVAPQSSLSRLGPAWSRRLSVRNPTEQSRSPFIAYPLTAPDVTVSGTPVETRTCKLETTIDARDTTRTGPVLAQTGGNT